ncbi:hypothetical protein GN956_G16314 [Arapaima gigas]
MLLLPFRRDERGLSLAHGCGLCETIARAEQRSCARDSSFSRVTICLPVCRRTKKWKSVEHVLHTDLHVKAWTPGQDLAGGTLGKEDHKDACV